MSNEIVFVSDLDNDEPMVSSRQVAEKFMKEVREKETELLEKCITHYFKWTFSEESFSSVFQKIFALTYCVPSRSSYFYVIEYRKRTKIGVTGKIEQRIKSNNSLMKESNKRVFFIKTFSSVERFIERSVKKTLSNRKSEGEFYSVKFDEIMNNLDDHGDLFHRLSKEHVSYLCQMCDYYSHFFSTKSLKCHVKSSEKNISGNMIPEQELLEFLNLVSKQIYQVKI